MDIPALSMAMATTDLQSKVGVAVLSNALDTAESTGDALTGMMKASMELSVNPAIGGSFDMYI